MVSIVVSPFVGAMTRVKPQPVHKARLLFGDKKTFVKGNAGSSFAPPLPPILVTWAGARAARSSRPALESRAAESAVLVGLRTEIQLLYLYPTFPLVPDFQTAAALRPASVPLLCLAS